MCLPAVIFTMVCDVTRHMIHTYRPTVIAEICAPSHSLWGSTLSHKLIIADTVLCVMATGFSSQIDYERVWYFVYMSDDCSICELQHDADAN
jgi:hypothetical protein